MDEKLKLVFEPYGWRMRVHLSKDGKQTICGQDAREWHNSGTATIEEFIQKDRRRCARCLRRARFSIKVDAAVSKINALIAETGKK